MTVLALKLLLAPLLLIGSSLAGPRWGVRVAGILVVLPVVAGPILLILYLEQAGRFAADMAKFGVTTAAAVIFAIFLLAVTSDQCPGPRPLLITRQIKSSVAAPGAGRSL
jgi:hypothetical protein